MKMHDNNGWGGYVWAAISALFTSLTFQDLVFAIGAVISAAIGIMTFVSNRRKNRAISEAVARTEEVKQQQELARSQMLAVYLERGYTVQDKPVPDSIVEVMKVVENSGMLDESAVAQSGN